MQLVLIGILILGLAHAQEIELEFRNSEYKIFTEPAKWQDASDHCVSLGMHLMAPGTKAENDFIHNYLKENNLQDYHYWIGLNDFTTEGEWDWITQCRATWTNWNPNEPNNLKGGEDCAVMIENSPNPSLINGMWNDIRCKRSAAYICEKEICPEGWFTCGCQCYKFVTDPLLNFDQAKEACTALDPEAYLVQMDADNELDCLRNIINDKKNGLKKTMRFVTSGHMEPQILGDNSGEWFWGDGSKIESFQWGKANEPNFKDNKEFCINLIRPYKFLENDSDCNMLQAYICEKPI